MVLKVIAVAWWPMRMMVRILGNTSFLGLGMVESLLGADHLASAIAYDQVGTFVGLALWGSFVASTYGAGESGWRPVLKRLSRFGPFLALLASLVFRVIDLPADVLVKPYALRGEVLSA